MNPRREAFLERVRKAVAAGNVSGKGHRPEPPRRFAYEGGGTNLLATFVEKLGTVGGKYHGVRSREELVGKVAWLVKQAAARRAVVGRGEFVDSLGIPRMLAQAACQCWLEPESGDVSEVAAAETRAVLFAADVGITQVDALIAATGSMVQLSRPGQARSLSLLPPVHIAVARRSQILPDLYDLFDGAWLSRSEIPACVTLITGPSKTGDIELQLVTGVHGPREVHVVLLEEGAAAVC